MNIFDILGPVMVGPSSSHTAGAARIGFVAMHLLQDTIENVHVVFHGSFAETGIGHGTDHAVIAGLLGMKPDDIRIPDSFHFASEAGLTYTFSTQNIAGAHPNTVVLSMKGKNGKTLEIQACSLGGGRIMINKLDGIDVNFSAENPTLVVHNIDQPGHVAKVTSMLSHKCVNIAAMQLYRDKRGGYAVMVIEADQQVPHESIQWLTHLAGILKVTYINV